MALYKVGDRVTRYIDAHTPRKRGVVTKVKRVTPSYSGPGITQYEVKWDSGEEGLYYMEVGLERE